MQVAQIFVGVLIPLYAGIRCILAMYGKNLPGLPIYIKSNVVKLFVLFILGTVIGYFWYVTVFIWMFFAIGISILNLALGGAFINGFLLFSTLFDGLSLEQVQKKRELQLRFQK